MAESGRVELENGDLPSSLDTPVIAIDARHAIIDFVAGSIIRATERGFSPLVIVDSRYQDDVIRYLHKLEATTIDISINTAKNSEPLETIHEISRDWGLPGIIYQKDPSSHVDFITSKEKYNSSSKYVVEAQLKPGKYKSENTLIGIPAYNEEKTIGQIVKKSLNFSPHVIVVDDGSDDDTAKIAKESGAKVISHTSNKGYGAALNTIFNEANQSAANQLVILDGDGQHNPDEISDLIEAHNEDNFDIVIGSRFIGNSNNEIPRYRLFGIWLINLLTNLSLGTLRKKSRISDTQSGFRLYGRKSIEILSNNHSISDGMGASTDIIHCANKYDLQVGEVGISVDYDVYNSNNKNPIPHGVHLVHNLLRTIETERPVAVLGIPGFILTIIGMVFGYGTIHQLIRSGSISMETAVASAIFSILGVFAAFTALNLHALNVHFRDRYIQDDS